MKYCIASLTLGMVAVAILPAAQDSAYAKALRQAVESFEAINEKLKSIVDAESAAAAKPDLRKAADSFVEARSKAAKLPPPDKDEKLRLEKQFKAKLDSAMKKLTLEIIRVEQIPGGKDALKEISAVLKKESK